MRSRRFPKIDANVAPVEHLGLKAKRAVYEYLGLLALEWDH